MTGGFERVVVVGASAAGLSAADGLREAGFTGSITVLGAELHQPYDRPTMSKALLVAEEDPQLLELRSPERIEASRLDLRLGHAAAGLDVDRRYVVTTYGEALPWDAVVIACGSRPREMRSLAGEVLPALRTPEDLRVLREAAARYGEMTLIGSGFIGLEVAAALVARGVTVTVLDALPLPLEPVLGTELATHLRDLHTAHGVRFRGAVAVASVTGRPGAYEVRLTDGSVHRTPFVLTGIGAEPAVDWLAGSGIEVTGGIVTDAAGRTNVPGVWAAGDVAAFHHPLLGQHVRVEHWTHAVEQGRHIGLNIARGETTPYQGVPYFWTDQYGMRFQCYGRRRAGDRSLVVEGSLDAGEFLVLFGHAGELHAAFACGRVRSLRDYRKLLARGGTWDEALALARTNNPALDTTVSCANRKERTTHEAA
ncbi:NAD(P)/FAD-dependent oxidoreductase [Streptomyces sp. NPDC001351]|uniref:NAD(P)/FAD-dependent oxidoreductase n=1 Tax=Streptomyces sp. NPDC001351 TaxID=3364564 RepID=UPI0036ABB618